MGAQAICISRFLRVHASVKTRKNSAFLLFSQAREKKMAVENATISGNTGNLNRDKMFNEAWWLNYCFCFGRAIGDIGNPYIGSEAKNICIHQTCEMTDVGDPWFDSI